VYLRIGGAFCFSDEMGTPEANMFKYRLVKWLIDSGIGESVLLLPVWVLVYFRLPRLLVLVSMCDKANVKPRSVGRGRVAQA
jgi:hypothetical protein